MKSETQSAILAWKSHPLCEHRMKSILLVALLALIVLLVRLAYPEPVWSILAGVLLGLSLSRYFLPTHYRLTEQGVEVIFLGYCKVRPWNEFRSYSVHPNGVLLSPFQKPHRLENYRGQFLLFGDLRENVVEFVKARMRRESDDVGKD